MRYCRRAFTIRYSLAALYQWKMIATIPYDVTAATVVVIVVVAFERMRINHTDDDVLLLLALLLSLLS